MTRPQLGETRTLYYIDYSNIEDGPVELTGVFCHGATGPMAQPQYYWDLETRPNPETTRLRALETGEAFEFLINEEFHLDEVKAYKRCISILENRINGMKDAIAFLWSQADGITMQHEEEEGS